jgi:hypothetical protein
MFPSSNQNIITLLAGGRLIAEGKEHHPIYGKISSDFYFVVLVSKYRGRP